MGVATGVIAFDLDKFNPSFVRRIFYTRLGTERLLGDAASRDMVRQRRAVGHFRDLYDDLEPPPATNGVNFWDLSLAARGTVLAHSTAVRYRTGYGKPGTGLLSGLLPDFLAERSAEAHRLWMRLLGRPADRDWFPFTVDGTTYRLARGESHGGCLQGDDVGALADALRPLLSDLPEFYEGLDERYRTSRAVAGRPVETLYGVCRTLADDVPGNLTLSVYPR